MAERAIYLCKVRISDVSKSGAPHFLCGHHFDEREENFRKHQLKGGIDKITTVNDELCEQCIEDQHNSQFTKARLRAAWRMESLLGGSKEQMKDDSL